MNTERIGRYILTTLIQENDEYSLWYAKNEDDNNKYLAKLANNNDKVLAAKLKYEFNLLQSMNIDGVPKPREYGKSASDHSYIIFENIDGLLLSEILLNEKVSLKHFFNYAILILKILGTLHENEIIYKNIQPNNIVVDEENNVALINFEIASHIGREIQDEIKSPDKLEGSLIYISPEQTGRLNRSVDYRSDFYSLGVLFYKMLSGKVPFYSEDPLELIHFHIAKLPSDITQNVMEAPETLSMIIMKMLEKDPDKRYQSTFGILSDLKACQDEWIKHGSVSRFEIAKNDIPHKFTVSDKLFGREDEINELIDIFNKSNNDNLSIATISGESGVGKTSLVLEVNRRCIIDNVYYISGKYDQYKRHIPYSAISSCINKLAEYIAILPKKKLDVVKDEILNAIGENAQLIIEIAPEWENILGKQAALPSVSGDQAQARFIHVFQRFMDVMCTSEHPIIMFIDDLQWIDPASIFLLKKILNPETISHFQFITAYRKNEVGENHPANLFLLELSKKTPIHTIHLSNLKKQDLNYLVESNFHSNYSETSELVEVLYRNTAGNPFFVNELLFDLYRKHLINFSATEGKWKWNISDVMEYNVSSNVLNFMLERLGELPDDVIQLLKFSSCLGVKFDLERLSLAADIPIKICSIKLLQAVKLGLIQPINFEYKIIEDEESSSGINKKAIYRFAHDQVQQAANSLIKKDEIATYYYKVAKSILAHESEEYINDNLITITQDYNHSIDIITSEIELSKLATLNKKSGLKAKDSFAYQEAIIFFNNCIKLIDKFEAIYEYNLYYKSSINKIECLYRLKSFDEAESESNDLLSKVSDSYDIAKIHNMRAAQYILYGMTNDAINSLHKGMTALGRNISLHPGHFKLLLEIFKFRLKYKRIDFAKKVYAGPKNFDKSETLYRRMLYFYSYYNLLANNVEDYIYSILKLSNHYLYDELCDGDLIGVIEIPLSIIFSDYKTAHEWSKLGYYWEDHVNQNKNIHVINFNHAFYSIWRYEPLNKTYELFQITLEQAAMRGDQFTESASAIFDITNRAALVGILEPVDEWPSILKRIKETNSQSIYMMAEQDYFYFKNLSGVEEINAKLTIDRDFSTNVIEKYKSQGWDVGIPNHLSYILMLSLIYESFERCYDDVNNYLPYAEVLEGNFYDVIVNIYIIFCASVTFDLNGQNRSWAVKLMATEKKKFDAWYEFNKDTFKPFVHIIEAQIAKFNGDISVAVMKYDEAYNEMVKLNYPQFIALLCEDISRFYRKLSNLQIAAYYLSLAQKAYHQWGAIRKVDLIKKSHGKFIEKYGFSVIDYDHSNSSQGTSRYNDKTGINTGQLDIYSLIKSSQAISKEIELRTLIDKMLKNLVENVGAENGSILLLKRDNFFLEGTYDISTEKSTSIGQSLPINVEHFPLKILNYVISKKEEVVIAEAKKDKRFESDDYIKINEPNSILCSPIIVKGNLIGLLYFENNKMTNAFTTDRIEILKILSSQVSISIENARFYDAFQHFVPKEFLNILGENNILDVNLGDQIHRKMTILTADIRGFTKLSEQLSSADTFSLLNNYLSSMEPIITKHGGFIDKYIGDAIMALFTTSVDDVVKCALEMIHVASLFKDSRINHKLKIGISINIGDLILGIVGSNTRYDSTVIGDTVNLASRIESLNTYYRTNLLVSEYVISQLNPDNQFLYRVVDSVRVKGKKRPVKLFEIFGYQTDKNALKRKQMIDKFNSAWDLYQSRRFEEAKILLENHIMEHPYDYVAHRILSYCNTFIKKGCPADWDGSIEMTHK